MYNFLEIFDVYLSSILSIVISGKYLFKDLIKSIISFSKSWTVLLSFKGLPIIIFSIFSFLDSSFKKSIRLSVSIVSNGKETTLL